MATYTLPKSVTAPAATLKPVSGCPQSLYYVVVKSAGGFQVVTKDGGIVQYSSALKMFCISWIEENDNVKEIA